MMRTTSTEWIDVDEVAALGDAEIWRPARAEYERMASLLRSLNAEDWARPTDCAAWTVRDTLGHLVGACEGLATRSSLCTSTAQVRA
jgi:hypothetical protein